MRQGAGAFVALKRRTKLGTNRMQAARRQVGDLIAQLRDDGLADEEIRRAFEAELLQAAEIARQR
jgi:DNA-binding transcriptional regulator YhcF (GntR family)